MTKVLPGRLRVELSFHGYKIMNGIDKLDVNVNGYTYEPEVMLLLLLLCVFNISPTAKVIWRRGHGLKSHPTDW